MFIGCARQTSPTGGPKDTIPPVLIKVHPQNEAVNFNAREIQLLFSENVILNQPQQQLIVTPTIGDAYELKYRKNIVTLTLTKPLEDSTTYTFSFRDAVQDITEKNPVRNLQLAYSTGDYIDSLSIEGTLYDLLRGEPLKDATVALHVKNDTFNIFEDKAPYFTKTDEDGNFKISHLKPNQYFIYGIQDKNRNLIVNSRSESYGFIAEYQTLTEDLEDVALGLVRLDAGPLALTSARPYNTYYNIRANKSLRTFRLDATDSTALTYTFGENQANIRLYDTFDRDSLQIHVIALDSIDNVVDTTLYAKFLTRTVTPEKFNMSIPETSLLPHKAALTTVLQFSKPITHINFDSIFFQVDSLHRVPILPEDLTWDPLLRTLTIQKTMDQSLYPPPEKATRSRRAAPIQQTREDSLRQTLTPINKINFRKAAFISVEQDTSAQTIENIKPLREGDLAVINVQIATDAPAYLVQLVNSKYTVIREVKNQRRVRFEDVLPGEYRVRLIIDRNDNGRWDPGNYFRRQEPEPVIYYRAPDGSTILKGVKANWEIGTEEAMLITY